jgi:hypothetical protein
MACHRTVCGAESRREEPARLTRLETSNTQTWWSRSLRGEGVQIKLFSFAQPSHTGTNHADSAHTKAQAPALPQLWGRGEGGGGGLIYDLGVDQSGLLLNCAQSRLNTSFSLSRGY